MRKPVSMAGHLGVRNGVVLVVAAVLAAGCGSTAPSPTASATPSTSVGPSSTLVATAPASTTPLPGGKLRIVIPTQTQDPAEDVAAPSFLDPQFDGSRWTAELWRRCLVRTLLSYNGRSVEEGGSRLQPDLARALPEISPDGSRWTFHLREGLHYGPPLEDVEITAPDFIRSFQRAVAPSLDLSAAWGGVFLPNVAGGLDYMSGNAASISGLEAPDDHTLVIRVINPVKGPPDLGFGALLAMAAAMPLPPDPVHQDAPFGAADGAGTGYGRYLVSSGPYMIEGTERLDFSVPAAVRSPAAGTTPSKITLVRNPSWDRAADSLRAAYPDRIEITFAAGVDEAIAALDAGRADLVWPTESLPAELVAAFGADPGRGHVHVDGAANVRSVILNLAVPPLDDIHVRKAISYAINKQHLADIQGGPAAYGVAGHIVADALEDNLLLDYDPYATPGGGGSLAAARAEMAKSAYDTNGDGRCESPSCAGVRVVTRPRYADVARSIADDLAPLGLVLDVDVLDPEAFSSTVDDPGSRVPVVVTFGLLHVAIDPGYDFAAFWSPGNFTVIPGQTVVAPWTSGMVGATPEWLTQWGYEVTTVPSVDGRIDACSALLGAPRFECFAALDQYLMENVVPWVPYNQTRYAAITGPQVVGYGFDELAQTTALDQLALKQ